MSDILYVIIPAYNEEGTIEQVVQSWYPIIEAHNGDGLSRLVIIDDGSKDRTWAIISQKRTELPLLLPLHKDNSGHGATILFGYKYAIQEKADYIFQTDSDGQTIPDEFAAFWKIREQYDMVIGQRNNRKDGKSRIFVTKVLKIVLKVMFNVKIPDANTPFRLMKTEQLKEQIKFIPDNFNLSNVLISVIYVKKHLKVRYIPITFRKRQGGTNSINMRKIFKLGFDAVKDFFVLRKTI